MKKKALCVVDKLVELERYTNLSENDVISLERENEYVDKLLDLYKIRYDNNMKFKINTNSNLTSVYVKRFTLFRNIITILNKEVQLSGNNETIEMFYIIKNNTIDINICVNNKGLLVKKSVDIEYIIDANEENKK